MHFKLAVLPGDGVGPEVMAEAVKVLETVGRKHGHTFDLLHGLVGGVSIDDNGEAISAATLKMCKSCDATLLGAVGGPKWDDPLARVRPEDGLLLLRKKLGLFANLRPVITFPSLVNQSNLKPEVIDGVDLIFVRELTGGLYYGRPKRRWTTSRGRRGIDTMAYSEQEIARIVRVGFELAVGRRHKLISVDKANVLETSRLWRTVVMEVAADYPDVAVEHMLVDACAMRIIQNPRHLDVVVTENTFGDILTDEASMLAGSLGMLSSASLAGIPSAGTRCYGLYEPSHGSAPKRAGLDVANPIATILSIAMMVRYTMGDAPAAANIEAAIGKVLDDGYGTYDIVSEGGRKVGTREMGDLVAARI